MLPVLRALGDADGGVQQMELTRRVADGLMLTEEERKLTLPSGRQTVIHNRTGWAGWYMKQAGLLDNVKRGVWAITQDGRQLLASNPECIDLKTLAAYPRFEAKMARNKDPDSGVVEPEMADQNDGQTPTEQIEEAHQKLNQTVATELREQMARMDPYKFEQLVIDLLFAMGYGGNRAEAALVTQKSNDEGIDGIINEDRLGLNVIYVQAKRWQSTVGRIEVQNFVGALAGKHATKGVFITTSDFHKNATEYASSVQHKVVLIGGQRLADLMIEHGVGVSTVRTIALKRVDSDYFED
ncbi:restriction endonuclease [Phragmitibacter flavus]|nr:restriction endonuclease [Phragmitibacter flavus]